MLNLNLNTLNAKTGLEIRKLISIHSDINVVQCILSVLMKGYSNNSPIDQKVVYLELKKRKGENENDQYFHIRP
jgi:hypothetical protein